MDHTKARGKGMLDGVGSTLCSVCKHTFRIGAWGDSVKDQETVIKKWRGNDLFLGFCG